MSNLEHEAKFWLPNHLGLQKQIKSLGASQVSPRHLERNFRFDTPDRRLTSQGEVLRVRDAPVVSITYKRPGESYEVRQEWELDVHDFEQARAFLEGLGYELIHRYEKYREIYEVNHCLVMLDEVPYGCFVEIEGPDLEIIKTTTHQLQMNWEARIQHTYMDMFETLRQKMEPTPVDATFDVFTDFPGIDATLLDLPSGYLHSIEEVDER